MNWKERMDCIKAISLSLSNKNIYYTERMIKYEIKKSKFYYINCLVPC